jgi:hypothetical protein
MHPGQIGQRSRVEHSGGAGAVEVKRTPQHSVGDGRWSNRGRVGLASKRALVLGHRSAQRSACSPVAQCREGL